jgi:two-component system, NtrC family, sensor histidine kinase AtoS
VGEINATGYAFLGLTVIVAMLVGVVMFAFLKFSSAARDTRRNLGNSRMESVLLATALEDAITRLKSQERATAARADASERLSGQIITSLTSGLIVVDGEGKVQTVNPAARRILQLPDGALSPETALDGVAPLRDVIVESLRTREPVLRRTVALDRPGESMHLGVAVSPLTAESGLGGAICLFSDLTSVVALEEQLRLKEALARLGELTAGLAHEFRNGLATIHGYARLLDPAVLPPQQRPYLEGIRAETQSLGDVVTNFLNFAKPEPLMLAPLDLRSLIEKAADDVPTARVKIHGVFEAVDGDDVLLRQAISNLFRNSVEACTAAGVQAEIDVAGEVDRTREAVVVTISDNGPGVQADAFAHLFQPFFTTRPGGTGLGLAIVQKIVVSHNGRISAANGDHGGAVFTLVLPLQTTREVRGM